MPTTETDTLLKISQGDPAAFTTLFKKYSPKVYSLALSLTKSEAAAEEIVQDVFMKAWENRSQLHNINFFSSWLRVVSKNTCYNYLRKKLTKNLH